MFGQNMCQNNYEIAHDFHVKLVCHTHLDLAVYIMCSIEVARITHAERKRSARFNTACSRRKGHALSLSQSGIRTPQTKKKKNRGIGK